MKRIVAIDPGASGGFAWATDYGVVCRPMPQTEGDVVALLRSLSCGNPDLVVMEQVGGYIGGAGAPGSAMFNFGMNFGVIKGAVQAFGMPLHTVYPQKWQKALSLGNKKDWDKQWKNHLKEKAQSLYPNTDGITLKTADALLILAYAVDNL